MLIRALLVLAMLVGAGMAAADQNDPRLDTLFVRLKAVDEAGAGAIDRQIWTIWLESGSTEIDRMMEQGILAMANRVWPVALTAFNAIIERAPDFAEGWNKRATLHFLMENYGASTVDVERTLALEPRHYGALSGMGLICLRRGRRAEALDWFDRALAINPHLDGIRDLVEELEPEVRGRPI